MVLGIGVDIMAVKRMEQILDASGSEFMTKVFTLNEQKQIETHSLKATQAALIFAAKEAIFKTFGISSDSGINFTEIEIGYGEYGQPEPVLSGKFAEIAREKGVSQVLLSLSYENDLVIAVAALRENPTLNPDR